jgi:DNA-binding LacI/PurR family transcriptional regulator
VPITIADVAARAGVSKTTVSRVLNAKGDLGDATAARVRAVIEQLGYVPSSRAVGLARGRTRIVGVLVPSLTWPWMGDVLQGAVDTLESESYGLLLYTEPANLERLLRRNLGHKRSLAAREYALGLESLERAARGEPLWRVHEAVFAVLALESEPVDPRL